jgi:hypothetical protein
MHQLSESGEPSIRSVWGYWVAALAGDGIAVIPAE